MKKNIGMRILEYLGNPHGQGVCGSAKEQIAKMVSKKDKNQKSKNARKKVDLDWSGWCFWRLENFASGCGVCVHPVWK